MPEPNGTKDKEVELVIDPMPCVLIMVVGSIGPSRALMDMVIVRWFLRTPIDGNVKLGSSTVTKTFSSSVLLHLKMIVLVELSQLAVGKVCEESDVLKTAWL